MTASPQISGPVERRAHPQVPLERPVPFRYHGGELAVQRAAGEEDRAARSAPGIRTTIPPAADEFLLSQPLLVVGSVDPAGDVWSSLLTGPPGFATVIDERTLLIAAAPARDDRLADALRSEPEVPIGLLAIEPHTRRRMRINGTAAWQEGTPIRVRTNEVYANCPKYVQRRELIDVTESPPRPPVTRVAEALTAADRRILRTADTFFIATAHPSRGVDVSHRGGNPGFVHVHDKRHLSWPDYPGNSMFMTLGNLTVNPRAGLLILDWETGDTLQLSGHTTLDLSPTSAGPHPGAERVVHFVAEHVIRRTGAHAMSWHLLERSRFNPARDEAGVAKP